MQMRTKTGAIPIGFRRGKTPWQNDLPALCAWAKTSGFQSIDLNVATAADIATVKSAGLELGSVDLIQIGEIATGDPGKRRELRDANAVYIRECAAAGAKIFFTIVGGDPARKRSENFKIAAESFAPLAETAASCGSVIAIEGYPGQAPHYALLCTTPETCRAMLKQIPRGLAINYDPSHLIRLGVDAVRFLREFIGHVVHVHAKDTQFFPEAIYEFGMHQPAAFAPPHGYGQHVWRYTLPGQGSADWSAICRTLGEVNYPGRLSIELEDENFNGTEAGEKAGLMQSLEFLSKV
jgi:sugar phosphate isomerase/epimerase